MQVGHTLINVSLLFLLWVWVVVGCVEFVDKIKLSLSISLREEKLNPFGQKYLLA
jgi:hypothetical protein